MRKLILPLGAVFVAVGVGGYVSYAVMRFEALPSTLNASLAKGGAALQGAPVPTVASYDLSAHQTLSRVILLIREHYVDPARVAPYEMFIAALGNIQKAVAEVMVDDTRAPDRVTVHVGRQSQDFNLGGLDQLWEVTMALRDIFQFLEAHISDPEKQRNIEYAAINGMLSTLDPHSVLLKPESFDEVKLSTKGEFGGLGIVISIRDNTLTIISPIEGTPASRVGLKAKDRVIKIGEESTVNMSLEEAVQRLRGKPGSKVTVWVLRKGWTEPRRFVITRAIIKIRSVNSEMLAGGIGYIRIKSFQNNTYDDLHTHLEKLQKKNRGELAGLVLDLRNNPGGLLDQAIYVSDRFVDRGPLVITVGEGDRRREEKTAHFSGTERDYPIVVLVNGGSASASEIVSGALRNHNRAVVIGQCTFGKGSVQVLYDFRDQSALKLTIAQYLTPGEMSIQSIGITPDVQIVPTLIEKDVIHLFAHDEVTREKDLDKHLDRYAGTAAARGTGPALRLLSLIEPDDDEQQQQQAATSESPFEMDFEIELAREVLLKASTTDRRTMLEEAAPLFAQRAQEQEQLIFNKLKELGVDWSPGLPSESATATLRLDVLQDGKKVVGPVAAGATLAFSATVRNEGVSTLNRIYGVTKSDSPLFDNLEFVFGAIAPRTSRSWKVEVKLPADMPSRADNVTFLLGGVAEGSIVEAIGQLGSPEAKPLASTSVIVQITEQDKPRFAYTYVIKDRAKGNGDGVLQVGEKVDLVVNVENLGPGAAAEALLTGKNLVGRAVFLDRGREKLGEIPAGSTKSGSLEFSLRSFEEVVKLRLSVWDAKLGASITEAIEIPVAAARKAKPQKRMLRIGKAEVPIYGGASSALPVLGFAKANASLRSDAAFGSGWRRVELPEGRIGFVREDGLRVAKGSLRRTSKTAVRYVRGQASPSLAVSVPGLVTSLSTLDLTGETRDESGLRDMFVFVGDKKIFYRSFEGIEAGAKGFSAPIAVSLPLKEGVNTVAVIVRENEFVSSRKVFGVFRQSIGAVAERTE